MRIMVLKEILAAALSACIWQSNKSLLKTYKMSFAS